MMPHLAYGKRDTTSESLKTGIAMLLLLLENLNEG